MSITWFELGNAVEDAKLTMRKADSCATGLAKIIVGRLRHVNDPYGDVLADLKRELRDYNMTTRTWK